MYDCQPVISTYGGPGGRATRRCLCDDGDAMIDDDDASIDDDDASNDANAHTAHGTGQSTYSPNKYRRIVYITNAWSMGKS